MAPPTTTRTTTTTTVGRPPDGNGNVVLAAGDIASCSSSGDSATAALLDTLPGEVLTLGDNAYERGTAAEFAQCYEPTWGRHRARTHPVPGNHEYGTAGASGYFGYFGDEAGTPGQGWYSWDLDGWHLVALNANCASVGGCGTGSAQERWLRDDLAAHPASCTLAYWHQPRFSSGLHGSSDVTAPLWQALYDAGADVVLEGHDHDYERFAPADPNGQRDDRRGIRSFVVGTGGRSLYPFQKEPLPITEARNSTSFGVLRLTLHERAYDWAFLPAEGSTFTESGSAACH